MNTVQRIAKNTGVLFVSQILSYILSFLFVMYTARYLGAEGFGTLSFAIAFTGIFGLFADLGLKTLIVREVARDKSLASKYLGNVVIIKIILAFLMFALTAITINFLGYSQQIINLVYLIAVSVIMFAFTQMFYSIFQSYEKMEYQSIGIILNSALLLLGALFLIFFGYSVVGFAYLYFIVSTIVLVYSSFICTWKFVLPTIEVDWTFWKFLLKESLPFAITGISITIYLYIDTILLSMLKGQEVVGWYNASYRLIMALLFIPVYINTSIFPFMSKSYITSKKSLKISFEKLLKLMIFIGIPIGIGTVLIANKVILLIYGNQFLKSVIILQILIWSLVLIFVRSPFERFFESVNKQAVVSKIAIIGVIFNIIANLILIPKYSYLGAGVVTVLTDIMILFFLVIASKNIGVSISKKVFIDIIKILIAGILMGILLKYLLDINLFILITAGAVIYLLISIILKIIDKDEIAMIKSIFGWNRYN